jgi:RNA polymerase sigma factor (sigma-70 family)
MMTKAEFADVAERHRERLVRLTQSRGHDYDAANDIVQDAIIACISGCHRYHNNTQAITDIKRTAWELSGGEITKAKARARYFTRVEDLEAAEQPNDDAVENQDLKIDVQRAIASLPNPEDRELAQLVLCEGYTRTQAFDALSDHYRSETQLWTVLTGYIIPTLKELLHDYERKRSITNFVTQRDAVLYCVVEQEHGHYHAYKTFKPVTVRRQTAYEAEQDRQLLERRFREQEQATRFDYSVINGPRPCFPFQSKLTKLGNRNRTRLFAVRKAQ